MATPLIVDRRARRERRERLRSFWSAVLAPWAAAVLWILLRDGLDSPMRPPSFAEALLVAALGVALSTLGAIGTTSLGRDEPVGIAGATLRGAAVGATGVVLVGSVAACAATLIFAASFLMMGLLYLLAGAFFGLLILLAGVLIGGGALFMVSAGYLAWRHSSRASTPLSPPSAASNLGAGVALAQYAAAAVVILGATALARAAGLLPPSWSLAWCALAAALPAVEGFRRSNPLRSVAW